MHGGGAAAAASRPQRPSPVRATIPISSVMKSGGNASPTRTTTAAWRTRFSSPEHSGQRSPGSSKGKSRALSANSGNCNAIRRTASLDAIYLKGHWPRDCFYWHIGTLQVDKATQTDETDWSDSRKMYFLTEGNDDKLEKYMIRQRLQRSSKEANSRLPSTSAVPGDHTLNTTTQTTASFLISPVLKANPMNIPLKPLARPTMRSSVEGLNQEIEKLVLKSTSSGDLQCSERNEEFSKFCQVTPEGHRAPLADLFRNTRSRSVNTQTPVAGDVSGSCHSSGGSQGSSPDQEGGRLGTSPHINRFLAREPPDGCEKVHLKSSVEERRQQAGMAPQPCTFQLRPSLGSAFQTPRSRDAAE